MKLKHRIKNSFSWLSVPIQSGPMKGKKWIISTGLNFLRGKFEPYKTDAFIKHFVKGSTFYDIGAHVGYFSGLASMLNEDSGKIFAFEPRPENANFFKKHSQINQFTNILLTQAAIGDRNGVARFNSNRGSATGKLAEDGNIEVELVHIDDWVKKGTIPPPDFVKIDVEGAEELVLNGCVQTIVTHRPKILIATHGPAKHKVVTDFLNKHNYSFEILNQDGARGDTEIMALPK